MRKILLTLSILIFGILNTFANWTSESSWYKEPILDNSLNFKATLEWNKVYTSWSVYNKSDGFVYYKVVRSQNNANPVYPEDSYIKYTTDVNDTAYIDTVPLNWSAYYRVCAITSEKNRYCSNVVKIYKEKIEEVKIGWDKDAHGCYISAWYSWCEVKSKCIRSWEEKCEKIEEVKICTQEAKLCSDWSYVWRSWPNCEFSSCPKKVEDSNISSSLKIKADKLVKSFIEKIEKAYSTTEKRVSVLTAVVDKLNTLATSKPTQKNLIDYIVNKLKSKIESYKWNDLWDIENIFNDLQ